MKTAICHLESLTELSWSRRHTTPHLEKEEDNAYEARTWKERFHYNQDGYCFIPPMAFKKCLEGVGKYLNMKVKGSGSATYTKHFKSGILVVEPLVLPEKKDDLEGEWFFVPSQPGRGSGSRVDKCFPVIRKWEGEVRYIILDDTITEKVFEEFLRQAGGLIGLGRFRPANGGYYGRFKVNSIEWIIEQREVA